MRSRQRHSFHGGSGSEFKQPLVLFNSRPLGRWLWLLASGLGLVSGQALTLTNVQPVNVTPSGFSVIWQVASPSNSTISVYADAAGTASLAGQLGVEQYPLNTGDPTAANAYEQRQSARTLAQGSRGFGLVMLRVSGCAPQTTYYYRVTSTATNGDVANWPPGNTLALVTTSPANSFVAESHQLIITVPGASVAGAQVTLSVSNAAYKLASVVGDGVSHNQVFFNLSDLLNASDLTTYQPVGDQTVQLDLLGPAATVTSKQFTLSFGTNFIVAQTDQGAFVLDSLAVTIGATNVYAGQSSAVGIFLQSSVGVTNVGVVLDFTASRLTNLAVVPVTGGILSGAVRPRGSGRVRLNLTLAGSQVFTNAQSVAWLNFLAPTAQGSAIVPLQIESLDFQRPDGKGLDVLSGASGRVVVVEKQPILEALRNSDGSRSAWLYGLTGANYWIEGAATPLSSASWGSLIRVSLTNLAQRVDGLSPTNRTRFFRARQE